MSNNYYLQVSDMVWIYCAFLIKNLENENDQLKLEYIHQQMSIHSVLCRRK